jgi:Sec-independent protein translocase protein TatA
VFGFSLAEIITILIVILLFIKPQDLPEIARFIGRLIFRAKRWWSDIKKSLKELERELGVDDLRHEINYGIASEKAKLDEETTIIVDMHGNEHRVPNLKEMRSDLDSAQLEEEIAKLNQQNSAIKNE